MQECQSIKVSAPGKIILSGEHATAYGCNAVAASMSYYSSIIIKKSVDDQWHIKLFDVSFECKKKTSDIKELYGQVESFFKKNDLSFSHINQLLPIPEGLYLYCIAHFLTQYDIWEEACDIKLFSDVPIGAGMGSSASTLTSLFFALHCYFKIPIDLKKLAENVSYVERLKHACMSRIDPYASALGGCLFFKEQTIDPMDVQWDHCWQLIYTGIPHATTSQCVSAVRKKFLKSTIWQDFQGVANNLKEALLSVSEAKIMQYILLNHQLLCKIGVVPDSVISFIDAVYRRTGACLKITGAGSVTGHQAGFLLAYLPFYNDNTMKYKKKFIDLCEKYHYQSYLFAADKKGVHIA